MALAMARQKDQLGFPENALDELVGWLTEGGFHRDLADIFETFHTVEATPPDHTDSRFNHLGYRASARATVGGRMGGSSSPCN